jgi:hypothetical protein
VQRVRNLLYVAGVPDLFQMAMERFVPLIVFERIEQDVPKQDLFRCLLDRAASYEAPIGDRSMQPLGLRNRPSDVEDSATAARSTRSSCWDA